MNFSASTLRLRCELALARVNLFLLLVALLSATLMLLCLFILPTLAKMELKEGAIVSKLKYSPKIVAPAPKDPLAEFNKVLLAESAQHQFLRTLSQQASRAGLKIGRIDFHTEPGSGVGFERLSIVIPVAATYPVLQAFAFSLLAEFPGLALEKIDMRREHVSLETVDAQLHFVLYVEPAA